LDQTGKGRRPPPQKKQLTTPTPAGHEQTPARQDQPAAQATKQPTARFVTHSNASPQRTPHKDAPQSPLREVRRAERRSLFSFVRRWPRAAGSAWPALTPLATRAPSRAVRSHRPARGRGLRARWSSVPVVRQRRISSVGPMERLFGARRSQPPFTQHQQAPIAQGISPLPAPWPKDAPPPKRRCSMLALARSQRRVTAKPGHGSPECCWIVAIKS